MDELSVASLSVTDSHLDRELAFTDQDHYLNVAKASGVPVVQGTPVHKHADASDLAERQKAEVRQSAIERYASETEGQWATASDGSRIALEHVDKAGTTEEPANSTVGVENARPPETSILDPVNTPPKDQAELTLKNLDTGEEFIIGENDPDFEFDTFELDPENLNRTFTDDSDRKGYCATKSGTSGSSPVASKKGSGKKSWLKKLLNLFFGRKRSTSTRSESEGAALARGAGTAQEDSRKELEPKEQKGVAKRTPFTQLSSFKFRRELGRGAFGRVLLAESKADGSLYALKIISKKNMRQSDRRQAKTERDILHAMSQTSPHPFTTGLKFAFQSENNLYLGMHYIPGGTLRELIKREGHLDIGWVTQYTSELVLAISHMHSLRMLYRDIKPHNVMIDAEGHINIIDFGLSKQEVMSPKGAMSLVGTPDYSAPEVLKTGVHQIESSKARRKEQRRMERECEKERERAKQRISVWGHREGKKAAPAIDGNKKMDTKKAESDAAANVGYGMAADWWSLGVMIFEMISGTPTFRGADLRQTYQKVLFAPVDFVPEDRFPDGNPRIQKAKSLISALLVRDPAMRLGSQGNPPKDIMSHKFFADVNWGDVYDRKSPGPWIPEAVSSSKRASRRDGKSERKERRNTLTRNQSSQECANNGMQVSNGEKGEEIRAGNTGATLCTKDASQEQRGVAHCTDTDNNNTKPTSIAAREEEASGGSHGEEAAECGVSPQAHTPGADLGVTRLRQISVDTARPISATEGGGDDLSVVGNPDGGPRDPGTMSKISEGSMSDAMSEGSRHSSTDRGKLEFGAGNVHTNAHEGYQGADKLDSGESDDPSDTSSATSTTDGTPRQSASDSSEESQFMSMRDSVFTPTATADKHNRLQDWSFFDEKMLLAAAGDEEIGKKRKNSKKKNKDKKSSERENGSEALAGTGKSLDEGGDTV